MIWSVFPYLPGLNLSRFEAHDLPFPGSLISFMLKGVLTELHMQAIDYFSLSRYGTLDGLEWGNDERGRRFDSASMQPAQGFGDAQRESQACSAWPLGMVMGIRNAADA